MALTTESKYTWKLKEGKDLIWVEFQEYTHIIAPKVYKNFSLKEGNWFLNADIKTYVKEKKVTMTKNKYWYNGMILNQLNYHGNP